MLLLFLAIAVDLSIAAVSQQQMRGYARLLALSAVESYFDSGGEPLTPRQRLEKALARTNEIAKTNSIIGGSGEQAHPIVLKGGQPGPNAGGLLIPGRYFYNRVGMDYCVDDACKTTCDSKSEMCNPCTIGRASAPDVPCFYELERREVERDENPLPPSAFRIEADLYGGVVTRFAQAIFGRTVVPISASSTATAISRHIMFVVDATASTMRETYVKRMLTAQESDPSRGRGSRYAFFLTRDNWQTLGQTSCQPDTSTSSHDMQWHFLEDYLPLQGYSSLSPRCAEPSTQHAVLRDTTALQPTSTLHYYDDYEIQEVISDSEKMPDSVPKSIQDLVRPELHPNSENCDDPDPAKHKYCATPEVYRIDTCCERADCGLGQPWCQGPQPLGAIFSGLKNAVSEFRGRMVAGDKMGLYFFDRFPVWTRLIQPTDQFDYLETAATNKGFGRAMKEFPGSQGYTDITAALAESISQLRKEQLKTGAPSQDAVVLITDGRANCSTCEGLSAAQAQEFDLDKNSVIDREDLKLMEQCLDCGSLKSSCPRCFTNDELGQVYNLADYHGCPFNCRNSFPWYQYATQKMRDFAKSLGGETGTIKVPIHVIPIGRDVAPHYIDLQDKNSTELRCLSEAEVRTLKLDPVRGGGGIGGDLTSCQLYDHNRLCDDAYGAASNETPFYESVYNLYQVARATGGYYLPLFLDQAAFCPAVDCKASPNSPECCKARDSNPMWTVDKYCRTPEEQMKDYVRQIVSDQSPFIVVEAS